ncbi:hypothetical protein PL373_13175 [Tenacibaculum maritimum]|nr:hypothetical protein [Tenacibaculum maritimum]MDB0600323.1 hypothetical protein [Tenacibaculum maritimum]MDB0602081.1 hypothetical protein [Tenacibaculum maritimum]MDB0610833.1 hypothetical protein [Tenacibaculum maritimum]
MTIIEKLKEALKKAGLNEGLADVINITTEDQIEGIVTQLKSTQQPSQEGLDFAKIVTSSEFSQFVEKNGFDKVLEMSKTLQSEHDKKVTKGVQTFKEKFMKTLDPNEGGEGKQDPKTEPNNDMPQWAKDLTAKIDGLEKNTQTSSKLEKAKIALKSSNIPEEFHEKYEGRYNLESDESFEDQTKKFETEITEYQQFFIGETSGKGLVFGKKVDTTKEDKDELKNLGKTF